MDGAFTNKNAFRALYRALLPFTSIFLFFFACAFILGTYINLGRKTSPHLSASKSLTWVSSGTLETAGCLCRPPRRRSILRLLLRGRPSRSMLYAKWRAYTGSSCIRHMSSLQGVPTSPAWRPCSQSTVIVLTGRAMSPNQSELILSGGLRGLRGPFSRVLSLPTPPTLPYRAKSLPVTYGYWPASTRLYLLYEKYIEH